MNIEHLRAFAWLRWRILYNTWRRAGAVSVVLMMIISVGMVVTAIPSLIGSFALGAYLIPKARPEYLMYAWDGLVAVFLFFWAIGLLTELQRSESLSLSKFLHLPVSVNGAFLINYLSSLLRLTLLMFVPAMLGYALALIYVQGVAQLPVLPLLAAFLLMVTALTYQLQGWLGALMSNPRRRRTVIVMMTGGFVLVAQLPNLINMLAPWGPQGRANQSNQLSQDLQKLTLAFQAKEFDAPEYLRRQTKLMEDSKLAGKEASRRALDAWQKGARLANVVLPIGWLPAGVMSSAEGRTWPAMLGLLGMTLIGAGSLARAYRSTILAYQGQATNSARRREPAEARPAGPAKPGAPVLEARLPGLSEPVSAIALGGFRSLLRAPEAKMMLLTPLIMLPIIGTMILRGGGTMPEMMRPMIAIGAMVFILFGLLQLMGNQFGFDRDGFRVFVLSAARRRDILLGKNLAFVPLLVPLVAIALVVVEFIYPMRIDHLLGMVPQYVSMYLLFCMLANALSIVAPVYIAAGAMKASNPKFTTVLLQLVMFLVLFPLTQGLTLLPLGIEALSRYQGWTDRAPVSLVLTLAECAAVVVFYRISLGWLGALLQSREKSILENVTNRG